MEFPKTISGYWRMNVSKPPCKIWDLEHIRCYQKSTVPLSEKCALAMQPADASPYPVTSPSMLLMSDITAHQLLRKCYIYTTAPSASMLLLVLPPNTASTLQLPLHLCCCWSFLPTLHLHCNIIPISDTEMDSLSSPYSTWNKQTLFFQGPW